MVLVVGAGVVAFGARSSGAAVPAGNLLTNPGAEAGTGSTDSSCGAGGTAPGWTASGGFTVVQYGTSGYPSTAVSSAIGGGANFFTGGCTASAAATQTIDVSAYAAAIDAGHVRLTLSGYLGGYLSQEDNAQVRVDFSNGDCCSGSVTIGPVTATDRGDQTALLARSAEATVPPGTRALVVNLLFTRVTGTDDDGSADNLSVSLTDTTVPANTNPPVISGSPVVGQTVSCSTGTWSNNPTSYAYQWLLDGQPIAGETGSSHAIGPDEAGHQLACTVTATNAGGSGSATSAPVTPTAPPPGAPVNTSLPQIGGSAIVGQTVSCSTGTWTKTPTSYGYQWLLDGQAIAGATGSTHAIAANEASHQLSCRVIATNAAGSASAVSTPVTPGGGGGGQPALQAVHGAAAAGKALLFTAAGGGPGARYKYRFSNGDTASCPGTQPVLSPIFNHAISGVRDTDRGAARWQHRHGDGAVCGLGGKSKAGRARLVGYACSPTQSSAPQYQQFKSGNKRLCLPPSADSTGAYPVGTPAPGYVDMQGEISQVALSDLTQADRRAMPFKTTKRSRKGFTPADDPTGDVFYASSCPVLINGLLVSPQSGHAVVLARGGGSTVRNGPDSLFVNPDGLYVVSGGVTVDVVAKGTAASIQVANKAIDWDVSKNTAGVAPIGNVKLSNSAAGIPGVGWIAGQVIHNYTSDTPFTTLAFAVKSGDYVTEIPFQLNLQVAGFNADGDVTLESDNANLLTLGNFDINVPDVFFGPVEFKNVGLHYTRLAQALAYPGDSEPAEAVPADSILGCAQAVIAAGLVTGRMVIGKVGSRPALKRFHIGYIGDLPLSVVRSATCCC